MKTIITSVLLILTGLSNTYGQDASDQVLVVRIINFNSNKGKALIALHNSKTNFLDKDFMSSISEIENNECTVTFKNVPSGTYAISLFHDENNNGKMDTNMFGIPKEDYGCSNNAKGFMGPPKWEDAKFEVTSKSVNQTIKL